MHAFRKKGSSGSSVNFTQSGAGRRIFQPTIDMETVRRTDTLMPLYFMAHEAAWFENRLRPALTESWRRRSFFPCRQLCEELRPAVISFVERFHENIEESVIVQVAQGLSFDRDYWRALAGEILLHGAAAIPEFPTMPETLELLTHGKCNPREELQREEFSNMQQVHFGSRDLVIGSCYRPEHAGFNTAADVVRLAEYLDTIDSGAWSADDLSYLHDLAAEDRPEELEYAREWFPALRDFYRSARERGWVVVCEQLG